MATWHMASRNAAIPAVASSCACIGFGINEADTCVRFAQAGDFDVGASSKG